MKDLYEDSWELYKAHTEEFDDDVTYYQNFVGHHPTLELFAGFGRVTNPLIAAGCALETVEINDKFSQFINLPTEKCHVDDVLKFQPTRPFARVFAAYNSFCLFTDETNIRAFFRQLSCFLEPGGLASLNYYHPDFWEDAVSGNFDLNGVDVSYTPHFDLSRRKTDKIGVWIDRFNVNGQEFAHEYTTRIYESAEDLLPFLEDTDLKLVNSVENFGKEEVLEPGWIDFVIKKQ